MRNEMRKANDCRTKRNVKWGLCGFSFLISYFSFSFSACSSIDCPVKNTVAVYYDVSQYDAAGELVADTLTDTLWVWTQRADGKDTLMNRFIDKSRFSLPISYQHPEDVLIFCIRDTSLTYTLDTVCLKKEDIPHFESVDCAAHYFHEITGVRCTHNGIDSLVLGTTSVTYDDAVTNLRIFFKDRHQLTPHDDTDDDTESDNDNEESEE